MKRTTLSRGFTLVEVLVVLVITALLSTLLFQALAQIYRLQGRFGEQLSQSQSGVLRVDWVRQVIHGLHPDFADGKQRFSGDSRRLSGLTNTPLGPTGESPQWITLEIDDAGGLSYTAREQRLSLLLAEGSGRAAFAYLDEAGVEHAQWPPMTIDTAKVGQLPAAVLIRRKEHVGQSVLVAAPRGVRETPVRSFVLGGGP